MPIQPITVYLSADLYFRRWDTSANRELWLTIQAHVKKDDFPSWLASLTTTTSPSSVGMPPNAPHQYLALTRGDLGDENANILDLFVPVPLNPAADFVVELTAGTISAFTFSGRQRSTALNIIDGNAFAAANTFAIDSTASGVPNSWQQISTFVPYAASFVNALVAMNSQSDAVRDHLAIALYGGSRRRIPKGVFDAATQTLVDLIDLGTTATGIPITNYHSLLGHTIRLDRDVSLATLGSKAVDGLVICVHQGTLKQRIDLSPDQQSKASWLDVFQHLTDAINPTWLSVTGELNPSLEYWVDVHDTPIVMLPQQIKSDSSDPLLLYRRRHELSKPTEMSGRLSPKSFETDQLNLRDVRQLTVYERQGATSSSSAISCRLWQLFDVALKPYRKSPTSDPSSNHLMRVMATPADAARFRDTLALRQEELRNAFFVDEGGTRLTSIEWIGSYQFPWDAPDAASGFVGLAFAAPAAPTKVTLLVPLKPEYDFHPMHATGNSPRWEVFEVDDARLSSSLKASSALPSLPFDAIELRLSSPESPNVFVPVVRVRGQAQFLLAQSVRSASAVVTATYPHGDVAGGTAVVTELRNDLVNFNALNVTDTTTRKKPIDLNVHENLMPFWSEPWASPGANGYRYRFRFQYRDTDPPKEWADIKSMHARAGQLRTFSFNVEHKSGDTLNLAMPKAQTAQRYDVPIENAASTSVRDDSGNNQTLLSATITGIGTANATVAITIHVSLLKATTNVAAPARRALSELANAASAYLVVRAFRYSAQSRPLDYALAPMIKPIVDVDGYSIELPSTAIASSLRYWAKWLEAGHLPSGDITTAAIPLGAIGVELQQATVVGMQLRIDRNSSGCPQANLPWDLRRSTWASRPEPPELDTIYGVSTLQVSTADVQTTALWKSWTQSISTRSSWLQPGWMTAPGTPRCSGLESAANFNQIVPALETDRWFDPGVPNSSGAAKLVAVPMSIRALAQDVRFGPRTYEVVAKILGLLQGIIDCALPSLPPTTTKTSSVTSADWRNWFESIAPVTTAFTNLVHALTFMVLPTPAPSDMQQLPPNVSDLIAQLRATSPNDFAKNLRKSLSECFASRPATFKDIKGWLLVTVGGVSDDLFRIAMQKGSDTHPKADLRSTYRYSDWIAEQLDQGHPYGFLDPLDPRTYWNYVSIADVLLQGFDEYVASCDAPITATNAKLAIDRQQLTVSLGSQPLPSQAEDALRMPLPARLPASAPAAFFQVQSPAMQDADALSKCANQRFDQDAFASGNFVQTPNVPNIGAYAVETAKSFAPKIDEVILTFCWTVRGDENKQSPSDAFADDALVLKIDPLDRLATRIERNKSGCASVDLNPFLALPDDVTSVTDDQLATLRMLVSAPVLCDVTNMLSQAASGDEYQGVLHHVRFTQVQSATIVTSIYDTLASQTPQLDANVESAMFVPSASNDPAAAYVVCNIKCDVWHAWRVQAELVRNRVAVASVAGSLFAPEFATFAVETGDPRVLRPSVYRDLASSPIIKMTRMMRSVAELTEALFPFAKNSGVWKNFSLAIACTPIHQFELPAQKLDGSPEGSRFEPTTLGQGVHARVSSYGKDPMAWNRPQVWFPAPRQHFLLRFAWFTEDNLEFFVIDNAVVEIA